MWRPSDRKAYSPSAYVPVMHCERTGGPPRDAEALRAEGFTDTQIERLARLDAHVEFTSSQREWGRVQLARYLIRTGRIREEC